MNTELRQVALRSIANGQGQISYKELIRRSGAEQSQLDAVLIGLRTDGLVEITTTGYRLKPKRTEEIPEDDLPPRRIEQMRAERDAERKFKIDTDAPEQAASEIEAPASQSARAPTEYTCRKCQQGKHRSQMCDRNGIPLKTCRDCFAEAQRKGQFELHARRAAQLARIAQRHTGGKSSSTPDRIEIVLEVRHSRSLRAQVDELQVNITMHDDERLSGSVTLNFDEAERLRDWLIAQALG